MKNFMIPILIQVRYNLRTRLSPDMQFSKNHKANYGASFKAKKNDVAFDKMPNILFLSKFDSLTQLSRPQVQYSNMWHCHFFIIYVRCPHAKNKENSSSRP